tara:strand:+ start:13717 stop:15192 length:1476 start_codon:yes stop_codon:yes gene_type:complete
MTKSWLSFLAIANDLYPEKIAIIEDDKNISWSYAQLYEQTLKTLSLFKQMDIRKGDRVAIYAKNRVEHLTLLFASTYLGSILVPMNYRLSHNESLEILDKVKPKAIFYEEGFCENVSYPVIDLDKINYKDYEASRMVEEINIDLPNLMLFSSGTTGQPKGILLHGRMLLSNQENTCRSWKLRNDDITLISTPFFHTGGYNVLCLPLLKLGATVIIKRDFDADNVLEIIEKYNLTVYFGVPSIFNMIAESQNFKEAQLESIRFFVSGGASCPVSLIETYQKKNIIFKQGFGLSEVGPNCFLLEGHEAIRKVGSIGRPMPHTNVLLLKEDGHLAGVDEVGEVLLSGEHVCAGYFNENERFKSCLFDGYFKTGDLAKMDKDGFFYIVGRKKDMYISGGENVYPAEVEKKIMEHPEISDVVIVPTKSAKWGEVGVAYLQGNKELTIEELRVFLNEGLSRYKHPQHLVNIKKMPLLDNGKVDRNQIKQMALANFGQ